jgi:hypothetical protein
MKPNEYLRAILTNQELSEDSPERKKLRATREEVERLLRTAFKKSNPSIRYGGSIAKGTIIRESYYLDVICYFAHTDTSPGETLEEIYNNVKGVLSQKYHVEAKTSALRLKGKVAPDRFVDFHVDVVPGRFVDENKDDVFLYQSHGDKKRLKTNLDKHIEFIRDSGYTDAIKLLKLWKARKVLSVKTFVLELLVIKVLSDSKTISALDKQLIYLWETVKEKKGQIGIEDPANPSGNDLSQIFNTSHQAELSTEAASTLDLIDRLGWESVFGQAEEPSDDQKITLITAASKNGSTRTKPWSSIE